MRPSPLAVITDHGLDFSDYEREVELWFIKIHFRVDGLFSGYVRT